ncbi:MAG: M56 family metallopeptidase [Niabella sp.]|nr:M56 family metallopeptidase [Niabella sp.]
MPQGIYHLFAALGYALFNSLWQMGVIWLLISLYRLLHPAPSKSLVSFWGLVTGFIAFISTFIITLSATPDGFGYPLFTGAWMQTVFNYSAALYLVLLIVPLRSIFSSSREVHRLRSGGERVSGSLKIFALDAAGYLGIKRKVQLFISSKIASPLTIGFLKPVILLPIAVVNQLSPRQLEAIILHELAHIKNNDYLINLVNQAILTFLYFNPFARQLVTLQELDREQSADRWVTQFQYDPHLYASTLLLLARNQVAANPLALHVSGNESQLKQRIRAIMGIAAPRSFPLRKIIILAAFLVLSGGYYYSGNTNGLLGVSIQSIPSYWIAESTPVMAAAEHTTGKNKLKIVPIPAIEQADSNPADNTVYLKITESPDGKIEAPVKPRPIEEATDANPLFVVNTTITTPALDSSAEHTVQESMKTFKQIVAELAWEKIENNLAETVSDAQKKTLKAQVIQAFDRFNWNENTDKLRSLYNEIDWARAEAQLNAQLERLVSLKARADCRTAMKRLQSHVNADSIAAAVKQLNKSKVATVQAVVEDSLKKIADL